MNQNFYVYEHWRPDTGLPFYVGKGARGRAGSITTRNEYHKRIVAKLKSLGLSLEVRKVFTYLDEDMAHTLEKTQISYWRARGISLTNLTDGGEGTSGFRYSDKQKETLRIAHAADKTREAKRAAALAAWARPSVREKQAAAREAAWSKPEAKARLSAGVTASWEKTREKRVAAQTAAQNRPEVRAKQGAISKEAQNRPDVLARMSASVRDAWARPEVRARILAAKKAARALRETSKKSNTV